MYFASYGLGAGGYDDATMQLSSSALCRLSFLTHLRESGPFADTI